MPLHAEHSKSGAVCDDGRSFVGFGGRLAPMNTQTSTAPSTDCVNRNSDSKPHQPQYVITNSHTQHPQRHACYAYRKSFHASHVKFFTLLVLHRVPLVTNHLTGVQCQRPHHGLAVSCVFCGRVGMCILWPSLAPVRLSGIVACVASRRFFFRSPIQHRSSRSSLWWCRPISLFRAGVPLPTCSIHCSVSVHGVKLSGPVR